MNGGGGGSQVLTKIEPFKMLSESFLQNVIVSFWNPLCYRTTGGCYKV